MLKRPHYIAIGAVFLLTLILLSLPPHAASRLKLAIGSMFLPLFGLSKSAEGAAAEAGNTLTPRGTLLKQIAELRLTNQLLQLKAVQADAVLQENTQLRQLLGWQRQLPWKVKLARVIARDPANWWQLIEIDLGSRDGIQPNWPVLAPDGSLVGRISAVNMTSSQVLLIGNPNCRVSAVVKSPHENESGVIIGAAGPVNSTLVNLSYLPSTSNLKAGQRVVTSGEGGVFPPDILIGQVAETPRPVEYGLYNEVRVKLAADLGTLKEVWVKVSP